MLTWNASLFADFPKWPLLLRETTHLVVSQRESDMFNSHLSKYQMHLRWQKQSEGNADYKIVALRGLFITQKCYTLI